MSIAAVNQENNFSLCPIHLPCLPSDNSTRSKIIRVAVEVFTEMTLNVGSTMAVMAILAVPISNLATPYFVIEFALTHILSAGCKLYKEFQTNPLQNQEKSSLLKTALRPFRINMLGLAHLANKLGPGIAIHEVGHAACAWAFIKNAQPRIEIFPLEGGMTSYQIQDGLSILAKFLHLNLPKAINACAAAGFLASLICALIEFGLAQSLQDSHPVLSDLLNLHGVVQIIQEASYAMGAFFTDSNESHHDFVFIWRATGIHPAFWIASLIAVPLVELYLLGR